MLSEITLTQARTAEKERAEFLSTETPELDPNKGEFTLKKVFPLSRFSERKKSNNPIKYSYILQR
jgi:hypothetical protein